MEASNLVQAKKKKMGEKDNTGVITKSVTSEWKQWKP